MKLLLSKNLILSLVVVAALAAGTALLAGYVDGPSQSTQATADSKCVDCPKAGTEDCCKVDGTCPEAKDCAKACEQGTCAMKSAAGSCQEKAQSSGGCQSVVQTSCGGCGQQ